MGACLLIRYVPPYIITINLLSKFIKWTLMNFHFHVRKLPIPLQVTIPLQLKQFNLMESIIYLQQDIQFPFPSPSYTHNHSRQPLCKKLHNLTYWCKSWHTSWTTSCILHELHQNISGNYILNPPLFNYACELNNSSIKLHLQSPPLSLIMVKS